MIFGKNIDEIVLQHSTRGMDVLQSLHPIEHTKIATEAFLKLPKGTVFLYTGFFVGGHAETDGPIGTYYLARALNKLGYKAIIVTDELCREFFKEIQTIEIPFQGFSDSKYINILEEYNPICHISIERCGKNSEGKYANMRGKDIGKKTAPLDDLFSLGQKYALTFGVGDGGNEIGMGNFKSSIKNALSLVPCIVTCDYPIIASVSNWGAYGFIAYMEEHYKEHVLPSFEEVDKYLEYIVSLGSVDGVKSENVKSVDGKEWYIEQEILSNLKTAIINHHNHFTMSDNYTQNSKSQLTIGTRLIKELDPLITTESTLLDLGCGPGVLTSQIKNRYSNKNIHVSGMDIDGAIIKKAYTTYDDIEFFVGSFFETNSKKEFDYIFSNEAMHWTPKIPTEYYKEENIIYYFFSKDVKAAYREWGLKNFQNSIEFINKTFTKNAVLQFGLDMQLHGIYKVINETLIELFSGDFKEIKFPLFYPTLDEVESIISSYPNLHIQKCETESIALSEKSVEEILGFIKGFTHNFFITTLGEEKIKNVYNLLRIKIAQNINEIREHQWKHCILVLSKTI